MLQTGHITKRIKRTRSTTELSDIQASGSSTENSVLFGYSSVFERNHDKNTTKGLNPVNMPSVKATYRRYCHKSGSAMKRKSDAQRIPCITTTKKEQGKNSNNNNSRSTPNTTHPHHRQATAPNTYRTRQCSSL